MINIFISPWRKRSCLLIYIYTVYRQWPVANCWSVGTDFKRFRSPNIILVSRGLNMLPCGALVAANESCAASEELFVGLKPYTSCFYVTRCLPVGVLVPLTYEVRCLYCIYSLHVTTTSSHPVHPPSYLSKRVLPTALTVLVMTFCLWSLYIRCLRQSCAHIRGNMTTQARATVFVLFVFLLE